MGTKQSSDDNDTIIEVFVDFDEGSVVREAVPAVDLGDGTYELLVSPGLALNLAKGDVIRVDSASAPATVVTRGGNFCIQIYESTIGEEDLERLDAQVREQFDGSLDTFNDGAVSFTIPARHGFDPVSDFFDELADDYDSDWFFGNIYKNFTDPEDDTLADWCSEL